MEKWEKYEKLVFKYAPLEEKKLVKQLLQQYLSEKNETTGTGMTWCVSILGCVVYVLKYTSLTCD